MPEGLSPRAVRPAARRTGCSTPGWDRRPSCGSCGEALPPPAEPLAVDQGSELDRAAARVGAAGAYRLLGPLVRPLPHGGAGESARWRTTTPAASWWSR